MPVTKKGCYPKRVDVQPGSAQNLEPDPLVNRGRGRRSDGQHRQRMYADTGEPDHQGSARRDSTGVARETQRHQGRPQHQACAMRNRHEKRPHEETSKPDLHAEAHAMTMTETPNAQPIKRSAAPTRTARPSTIQPNQRKTSATAATDTACPKAIGTTANQTMRRFFR